MDKQNNLKLEWEENWQARVGAWFPGERVIMHGENILETMQGKTLLEVLLFGATGKKVEPARARLLDEVLAYAGSIPDPRLWNNRVAALGATARTTSILAVSAATAISDAIIYGFKPTICAYHMYKDLLGKLAQGKTLVSLLEERLSERKNLLHQKQRGKSSNGKNRAVDYIPGFGRPMVKNDERFPPLMATLKKHNAHEGPAIKLAHAIQSTLSEMGYKLNLNMGGIIAAIGVDQDLGTQEFLHYLTFCFSPGLMTCFDDAISQPEGRFFPMRCEQIEYKGESLRQWPSEN